jgi:hypothetical protein
VVPRRGRACSSPPGRATTRATAASMTARACPVRAAARPCRPAARATTTARRSGARMPSDEARLATRCRPDRAGQHSAQLRRRASPRAWT